MIVLADNLKKLMKEKGWNQKEFAKKVHVTEAAMSHYLSGYRDPQLDILIRIADCLEVSVDFLLGIEFQSVDSQFDKLTMMIKDYKGNLTPEERMKLIMLLSA
ncbi:MAG: helix-turn-helix transcriptional regulator [Bacilli bacterium]|nr:helix-turn-helix transcriptional regulator [Bacilli bacterium]